jgi:hypothetical protein
VLPMRSKLLMPNFFTSALVSAVMPCAGGCTPSRLPLGGTAAAWRPFPLLPPYHFIPTKLPLCVRDVALPGAWGGVKKHGMACGRSTSAAGEGRLRTSPSNLASSTYTGQHCPVQYQPSYPSDRKVGSLLPACDWDVLEFYFL